jgi:hypothetical protein
MKINNDIIKNAVFLLILLFSAATEAKNRKGGHYRTYKKYRLCPYIQKDGLTFDMSTKSMYTSSGHGLITSYNVGMGLCKDMVNIGIICNAESNKMLGIHSEYRDYLSALGHRTTTYSYIRGLYHTSSPLSSNMNRKIYGSDYTEGYATFETLEVYTGFGFQRYLPGHIYVTANAGVGAYFSALYDYSDKRIKDYQDIRPDKYMAFEVAVGLGLQF